MPKTHETREKYRFELLGSKPNRYVARPDSNKVVSTLQQPNKKLEIKTLIGSFSYLSLK